MFLTQQHKRGGVLQQTAHILKWEIRGSVQTKISFIAAKQNNTECFIMYLDFVKTHVQKTNLFFFFKKLQVLFLISYYVFL